MVGARWAALGLVVGVAGCAATPETGQASSPTTERAAAIAPDPRTIGRPPEQLGPGARQQLEAALQVRGRLDATPLPGELREALVALQEANGLAPTGWLDSDTAEALELSPEEVLPLEAGAGVYRTPGATLGGGQVGGEPGPASLPPDPAELGANLPAASADPAFHFAEARRLRAAARVLRGQAAQAGDPAVRGRLEAQADKAEHVFRLHAEQLEALGGESALAGRVVAPETGQLALPSGGLQDGGEVRTALPLRDDTVALDRDEIERMQRTLWSEGFFHQAPSGELDDPTRQAIRAWQTAQGWRPTGAVDERTADRLLAAPEGDRPQGLEPPGSPQPGGPAPGEADGGGETGE